MTYVREQLRQRLAGQVSRAFRRWQHPTSGRQPCDRFLEQWTPADLTLAWSHEGLRTRNGHHYRDGSDLSV
jgi:hypothetical protein